MRIKVFYLLSSYLITAITVTGQSKLPFNKFWSLNGNLKTDTAINFIGTRDSVPLIIKVNQQQSGFIDFKSANTILGYQAMMNKSSYANCAFGYQALQHNTSAHNIAIGYRALYSNTSGGNNVASGDQALYYNTTGFANTAVGHDALFQNETGDYNTAVGHRALIDNIKGRYNTAIGNEALEENSADNNTAVGYSSLEFNTFGTLNTAVGISSLMLNTEGNYNTATGLNSLLHNTTGDGNTAYGCSSLTNNYRGNYNTAVGYGVNVSERGLNNTTMLGAYAFADASNKVMIGNTSVTSIGGQVEWTSFSDERIKQNIKEDVPGLSFINKLRPVTYQVNLTNENKLLDIKDSVYWDDKNAIEKMRFTGFLAQDVDKVAKSINYNFSGIDKSGKLMGLRYSEFVVPLVKAAQQLSSKVDSLQKQIDNLESKFQNQQEEIERLKAMFNVSKESSGTSLYVNSDKSSLSQNIPNPFSSSTMINYALPTSFSSASIIITNKDGVSLKEIALKNDGKNSIIVNASAFTSGSYQYGLYINKKLISSKKMIVIK